MQPHRPSMKHSFKMSIESRNSVGSSCRSLQRPSWSSRPHSLSKNHSMLEVMSLESNRKSDIYDKLISVENQPALSRQSMGGIIETNNQYTYPQQIYEEVPKLNQRKSEDEGCTINHTCICYSDCQWATCPCMQSKYQLCVTEYCCSQCIANKNALLRGEGLHQQQAVQVSCTCKKTKCNKKYCSCFAAGVLCGEKCSCQGCINCPQQPSNMMEIEQQDANYIPEEVLAQMPMPQNMDFQPVEFRFSNNN